LRAARFADGRRVILWLQDDAARFQGDIARRREHLLLSNNDPDFEGQQMQGRTPRTPRDLLAAMPNGVDPETEPAPLEPAPELRGPRVRVISRRCLVVRGRVPGQANANQQPK
jgi:hypothetical protein